MLLYHGSKDVVKEPEIRIVRYNKDFYFGFYCTVLADQAIRWAVRFKSAGFVNVYDYVPNPELKVKRFPEMSEEWLDFVIACRSGESHPYDIVEGPMADDQIYDHIQELLDGEITREAFWALAKFKYPTHQISFHTVRALATLTFVQAVTVREGMSGREIAQSVRKGRGEDEG